MMGKRGTVMLMEDIIVIIINVVFVFILITFVISRVSNASVYEEKYAKEIALALDAAKPGMMIELSMSEVGKGLDTVIYGKYNLDKSVLINGNIVTVKFTGRGTGYSYSFFNDVNVTNYYFDKADKEYVFFIGGYNEQKGG